MKRYIRSNESVQSSEGTKPINKSEAKKLARELIMKQISTIGYGAGYEEFIEKFNDVHEGEALLKAEMDRVAHLFGMKSAHFG